uniref:Uncharacterized protein n=1 Tax=Triticum urartu TaxID=4572 RepID=A0A8R7THY2_TRIUA
HCPTWNTGLFLAVGDLSVATSGLISYGTSYSIHRLQDLRNLIGVLHMVAL